jgi:deoxyribonuclease-4
MRFGFHISIAGGFSKVVGRATKTGCETIQLFSRNPRGWKYSPLNEEDVKRFKDSIKIAKIYPVFVHMPYLPNLASPDERLYSISINSLKEELKRAEVLGASFVITHIGSRLTLSEDEAIARVTNAINEALNYIENSVILLLENTAGGGTEIGYKFFHIAKIFEKISKKDRIGVCLDTAHTYEAGYDIRNNLKSTIQEFDRLIGLDRLHLIHLNDSKTPLGSHSDRHWHIGEGYIGLDAFRNIVNHPKFVHLPGIMETPRKTNIEDIKNMEVIRNLVKI